MPSTDVSSSFDRDLFRRLHRAFRKQVKLEVKQSAQEEPGVRMKLLRDTGMRAWKLATPIPLGRPTNRETQAALELRKQRKSWPEIFRQVLGPKPEGDKAAFCWDCAAKSLQNAVRRRERRAPLDRSAQANARVEADQLPRERTIGQRPGR